MSVGWRSGVHWMRPTAAPSIEALSERASIVFAVPGTSSNRTWPRQTSAATTSSICLRLPSTTRPAFSTSRPAISIALPTFSFMGEQSYAR